MDFIDTLRQFSKIAQDRRPQIQNYHTRNQTVQKKNTYNKEKIYDIFTISKTSGGENKCLKIYLSK